MAFALAGVLGGCSGARLSDHSLRQPTLRVADAALASGAPDLALRVADIVLAKNPGNTLALITRGDALYALGRGDMAQAAYRGAIETNPAAVSAEVGLGRILAKSDPRSAEAAFLSALTSDPDNVVALNNLGVVRDLQGRNAEAQEAYNAALTVAPGSADVQINLGMSLALSGRSAEAVQLLRGVVAVPGASRAWRHELLAGLTLAGDGPWAQQMLQGDPAQTPQDPAFAAEGTRLAATPTVPISKGSGLVETGHAILSVPGVMVAEIPAGIQIPVADPAPRTPIIATELPAIVPVADVASLVTIRPVVAVFGKLAKVLSSPRDSISSSPQDSMSSPIDIDRATSASVPEARMPIAASKSTPSIATEARDVNTTGDSPYVQLGSLLSEPDAMFEWRRLNRRVAGLLRGREPTMTQAKVHGRTYWRLRAWNFESLDETNQLCGRLKAAGLGCWTGRGL
jgi:Flp pilus assembly protein TadD